MTYSPGALHSGACVMRRHVRPAGEEPEHDPEAAFSDNIMLH
jgi:hypothetical protein